MSDFPELTEIVPEYHSRNPLVRWLFHKRLELALELARLDDENRAFQVLDLGCGEGLTLRKLKEAYPRHILTGVDHNPHVADLKIPGVETRQADLTKPGALAPRFYDRILCLDVLEHIQDLSGPLAAIRVALAPGGLLVISAPAENVFHKTCRFLIKRTFSEKEGPASSPHYHRAATLKRDIPAAGFELVDSASLPLPGPLSLLQFYSFRQKSKA